MRRCWRNARKRPVERGVGNGYYMRKDLYRPTEIAVDFFVRDNWEDYMSLEIYERDEHPTFSRHWWYVNNSWMDAVWNAILSLWEDRDIVENFFMAGIYNWDVAFATQWTRWVFADRFIEILNDIYTTQSQESVEALYAYITEVTEKAMEWDFSEIWLNFTEVPQWDVTDIELSTYEIDWTNLSRFELTYSILPRMAYDFREEITFDPPDACGSGGYGSWQIYRDILKKDKPITVTVSVWQIQATCVVNFYR